MYTLYYSPFSCSLAVHIALQKIGDEFKLEKTDVRKGMHTKEAFLDLNKRGKVPVLQDGDQFIDQGAAILLYLNDKHPSAHIIPSVDHPKRSHALSSLLYMSNTVHPTFAMLFYPDRFTHGDKNDVFKSSTAKAMSLLTELNQALDGQAFLSGEEAYAADYYLTTILNWPQLFKINLKEYPNLIAYKKRMDALPEVSQAVKSEMTEF